MVPRISRGGSGLPNRVILHGCEGSGKCLGRGTPVLMHDGTVRPVEQVRAGDLVMGPDSLPRTVLGTTSGRAMLYRVTQSDGSSYLANAEHVLALKISVSTMCGFSWDEWPVNVRIREYLHWPEPERQAFRGWKVNDPSRPDSGRELLQITVEEAGLGDYHGFELDGDHLFLLGDRTVTHNSSTFAYAPNPLFLMTRGETGLLTLIDHGRVPPVDHYDTAMTWRELLEQVRHATENDTGHKYVVLDTLNGAERLCFQHVTDEQFDGSVQAFGNYGKGVDVAMGEWQRLFDMLDELRRVRRVGIALLAHTKVSTFKNPEGDDFDRYSPDCSVKGWGMAHKWADIVLFAAFDDFAKKDKGALKAKGVGGVKRSFHTTRTAAYDAKNRIGLPATIPMYDAPDGGWRALVKAMKEAKAATLAATAAAGKTAPPAAQSATTSSAPADPYEVLTGTPAPAIQTSPETANPTTTDSTPGE